MCIQIPTYRRPTGVREKQMRSMRTSAGTEKRRKMGMQNFVRPTLTITLIIIQLRMLIGANFEHSMGPQESIYI